MRKLSITLIVLVVAGLVLSACGGAPAPAAPASQPAQSQPAATTAPAATAAPAAAEQATTAPAASGGMQHSSGMASDNSYDVHFIDSTIEHHAGVIAMAEQALKEGQSVAAKDLAQKSMTAAQKEIDQLKAWRTQWHPNAPVMKDDMASMGSMGIGSDTATPFDKRFAAAMISHHQGSIDMAKDGLGQLEHPELKQFAEQLIAGEQAEIGEYQKLTQ